MLAVEGVNEVTRNVKLVKSSRVLLIMQCIPMGSQIHICGIMWVIVIHNYGVMGLLLEQI